MKSSMTALNSFTNAIPVGLSLIDRRTQASFRAFLLWDPEAWNNSCVPLPDTHSKRSLPTRRCASHLRLRERIRVNCLNIHTGIIYIAKFFICNEWQCLRLLMLTLSQAFQMQCTRQIKGHGISQGRGIMYYARIMLCIVSISRRLNCISIIGEGLLRWHSLFNSQGQVFVQV